MDLKFADIPNGLAAIGKVPVAGWAQILAYMAFCEISQKQIPGTPAYDGDFGWKVITSDDPEIKKKKLNSEIANGRLAMMGIIGLFFQDGLTGSPWGYWAGNPSSFWKAPRVFRRSCMRERVAMGPESLETSIFGCHIANTYTHTYIYTHMRICIYMYIHS